MIYELILKILKRVFIFSTSKISWWTSIVASKIKFQKTKCKKKKKKKEIHTFQFYNKCKRSSKINENIVI